MVLSWALCPSTVIGGSCSDFPWHIPRDMVMPEIIQQGQDAMKTGHLLEARELFSTYLNQQNDGLVADGVRWIMASLPEPSDEPGKEFFKRIDRLQAMRTNSSKSVYAPWALCAIGDVYWEAGWYSEASGMFEEFLRTYPEHPLAGGVMVEAGLGYMKNGQYLEAALVLRRVVEEPKWKAHRLKGALGLADATSMAKAWKQAYYWFRVVEAEMPELIRQSGDSSYHYGLAELAAGNPAKALSRFLVTVNIHPRLETAGLALNRISENLLKEGHGYLALWFADQARQQFPGREPARRGQAALTRWVVSFLSQDHVKEEWDTVYRRLDDLEIYLSLSWDHVLETARPLSQAPEVDLVEESVLWMGRAYHSLGDVPAAVHALAHLIVVASSDDRRLEAQERLSRLLNEQIRFFYGRKAWVALLKFHTDHQQAFHLVPLERERVLLVAQAYQQVNLPLEALHWYDQLLQEYPDSPIREDLLAQKVLLAEEQGNGPLVREVGRVYLQDFPEGRGRGQVEIALGMEALASKRYAEAIQKLSEALQDANGITEQLHVLRNRARAYRALGQLESSIQDLRQVVSLQPGRMADVIRLGDSVFDHGEFAEAERLYDQVLASDAPVALKAWAKYRLAISLEHMGQYPEAQKLLDELRQLETSSRELEHTIRSAATAVLDEISLKEKPRLEITDEQTKS